MDQHSFHLIQGDNNEHLLFHTSSLSIIKINEVVYNLLYLYQTKGNINEIATELSMEPRIIEEFLADIQNIIPNTINDSPASEKKNIINRITLHVSNDCNLACKYCYADGGNYKTIKGVMNIQTADNFLSFCANNFDSVTNIVFFGGEPLMNPEIIEYICNGFKKLKLDNTIAYTPTFGIITNGTILNNRILDLIKKHISFITISIDGSPEINDSNRIFKSGKGSYSHIEKFIRTMQVSTEVFIKYEATYNSCHYQKGVSKTDLVKYMKAEFGLYGSIVNEINFNISDDPDYIAKINAMDSLTNEDFINFPEGFFSILSAIVSKNYKEMCLVGQNIFAVTIDGDIYPCHMNIGNNKVCLGNVQGENIFTNKVKYQNMFPNLRAITKTGEPCRSCWANPICGGCAMRWFFDGKRNEYMQNPNETLCQSNKRHIERILLLIYKLRTNPQKWSELLEILKCSNSPYYYVN